MINSVATAALFFSIFLKCPLQEVQTGKLEVIVKNVKSDKGMVLVGLSDSQEDFASQETAAIGKKGSVQNGVATVVFDNLPYGTYAAKVMHDENDNDKMDFNFFGLPKESYGFSNNPKSLGIPAFDKAKFTLDSQSKTIVIELN